MSFRSRARRLQRALGVTYQQALAKIRVNAEEAAAMARERGWPLGRCDLELAGAPPPIEVVEMQTAEDPIHEICARLVERTLARAVMVYDGRNLLARVGKIEGVVLAPRIVGPQRPQPPTPLDLGEGRSVHWAPLDDGRAMLSVIYDESTSLGLVRLRTARAVEELEPLLAARRRGGGAPPPPARGGPSGAPAEAWLSLAALRKRRP